MPSAFSVSRASRTRLADRAVTPMACGSMPSGQPRADPFGKETELFATGLPPPAAAGRAVHRGPVAEQGVHLAVQAGHRIRPEQRYRPGQDLLGGPVVQGQPPAPPAHADPQAGEGDPVVVDALVRVGRDEQVVGPGATAARSSRHWAGCRSWASSTRMCR